MRVLPDLGRGSGRQGALHWGQVMIMLGICSVLYRCPGRGASTYGVRVSMRVSAIGADPAASARDGCKTYLA
jgi:hypothetical protein